MRRPAPVDLTGADALAWADVEVRGGSRFGATLWVRSLMADAADARLMWLREDAKANTTEAWEDWTTHRREWFPASWGLA